MADFDGSNDLVTTAAVTYGDADGPDGYSASYFGTDYNPDTSSPVISNWVPSPGTTILSNQPLQFDVTDPDGNIRRCLVKVSIAGSLDWELPKDGDFFSPRYLAGSTRVSITNGFRYVLVRAGGWNGTPTIEPFCYDTAGNDLA